MIVEKRTITVKKENEEVSYYLDDVSSCRAFKETIIREPTKDGIKRHKYKMLTNSLFYLIASISLFVLAWLVLNKKIDGYYLSGVFPMFAGIYFAYVCFSSLMDVSNAPKRQVPVYFITIGHGEIEIYIGQTDTEENALKIKHFIDKLKIDKNDMKKYTVDFNTGSIVAA